MSITNELNKIKNAVCGKEVRGAIHDAIKECYDSAATEYDNTNMEVILARGTHDTLNERLGETDVFIKQINDELGARIDNLISLTENPGIDNAELIDIRVGYDAQIYETAGTAIRTQFKSFNDKIAEFEEGIFWHNLLDLSKLTKGYLDLKGKHTDSQNYYYTNFIPFSANLSIQLLRADRSDLFQSTKFRQANMRFVTTYDINKEVISSSGAENVDTFFKTTDVNVKYVRITILSGYIDDAKNNTMLKFGETAPVEHSYSAYGYSQKGLNLYNKYSNLNGKKVAVFGDSIAFGAGNGGIGIAELLSEFYGCASKNYAVSGATVIQSSNCILQQYDKLISDHTTGNTLICELDYIIFDGGANDMLTDSLSELGELSNYYGNNVTANNFTGALETLIRNFQTNFPHTKIIYFTNHHMPTRNKINMDTYFDRAKDVMRKYGVEVIDIYLNSGLNTCIGTQHEVYCPDKTHPNREGYLKYYLPHISNAMNNAI